MVFAGCTCPRMRTEHKEHVNSLKEDLAQKLTQTDEQLQTISQLKAQLEAKEAALKEKDAKIQDLKEKLKNFGVFE
jgi:septal ring factor EnvC (AmiA/AmiB activator)